MDLWRLLRAITVGTAVLVLGACTAAGAGPPATAGPTVTPSAPASGEPTPGAPAAPPGQPSPGSPESQNPALPGLPAGPTSLDRPVPKVQRGEPAEPRVTTTPVDTREQVTYPDGLRLRITEVVFAEEKGEGPGRFPGRQLALLSLELHNGTSTEVPLDTVVVTVLDRSGQSVAPVYVEGNDVRDFAGVVPAGASATARYAFAVPAESRSQVTVVVDFDGVHTSAVFRGRLD